MRQKPLLLIHQMSQKQDDFKALQATWYAKLKSRGFKDIEDSQGRPHDWHSFRFTSSCNPVVHAIRSEHYRRAGQFLYDHKFKTVLEKFIWEQHAKGKYPREITKMLLQKNISLHKNTVANTITRLKSLMIAFYEVNRD